MQATHIRLKVPGTIGSSDDIDLDAPDGYMVMLHAVLDPETFEPIEYRPGKVRPGQEFIWRAHPGSIPGHQFEVVDDPRTDEQRQADEDEWSKYAARCAECRKTGEWPGPQPTWAGAPSRVMAERKFWEETGLDPRQPEAKGRGHRKLPKGPRAHVKPEKTVSTVKDGKVTGAATRRRSGRRAGARPSDVS